LAAGAGVAKPAHHHAVREREIAPRAGQVRHLSVAEVGPATTIAEPHPQIRPGYLELAAGNEQGG
jgi:hypothetical protein